MKKIIFAGYTGRENRGTEAIARSTADIFHSFSLSSAVAFRTKKEYDENLSLPYFDECCMYRKYDNKVFSYLNALYNKIFGNTDLYQRFCHKEIFKLAKNNAILHIGGDTYCYGVSLENMALTHLCKKKKIPLFLWAASLDAEALENKIILTSLKQYDKLYIREQHSYNLLLEKGFDKENLYKMADPAFTLQPEQIDLDSDWWKQGKVLGINLSPFATNENKNHDLAIDGCVSVIDYILNETDWNIALIPHVFKDDYKFRDYESLLKLKEQYTGNERVRLLAEDYNCNQLKYIISQCGFLIAARTHASIAAYSSFVPTLVLGYSIKSKGIATDLFGSYEDYVLPVQQLNNSNQIFNAFLNLYQNRIDIENKLKLTIPEYQKLVSSATSDLNNFLASKENNN